MLAGNDIERSGTRRRESRLAALAHGLPPSAGIALGFDRLVMLATGASHIEDTIWAPVALAGFDDPRAR